MEEDTTIHVDATAPEIVQIVIRNDGKVVWVNVDGVCLFRACRIKKLVIEDQKKWEVVNGSIDPSRTAANEKQRIVDKGKVRPRRLRSSDKLH